MTYIIKKHEKSNQKFITWIISNDNLINLLSYVGKICLEKNS